MEVSKPTQISYGMKNIEAVPQYNDTEMIAEEAKGHLRSIECDWLYSQPLYFLTAQASLRAGVAEQYPG
jgi:hypothetical protein